MTHVLYIDMASEQLAILEAGEDIPNRYFGLTFVEQGTAAECIAAAREYASRMTEPYCIGFSLATEASR